MIHKWILKDETILLLCDRCSKKDYKNLIIREPWKATDKHNTAICDRCGSKEEINF